MNVYQCVIRDIVCRGGCVSEGELERIRRRIREWAERGMTRGEIARAVERVSGYVQFVYCADPVGYE